MSKVIYLKSLFNKDKPNKKELSNCSKYFNEEITKLKNLKVIVTLGKVAFDNCIKIYNNKFQNPKKYVFKHGQTQLLPNKTIIIPCYHPSPRNVNTGVISYKMMVRLFVKAKTLAKI